MKHTHTETSTDTQKVRKKHDSREKSRKKSVCLLSVSLRARKGNNVFYDRV